MDFNDNKELATFLEDGLPEIFKRKPTSMAIVASLEDGTTLTGYFHADAQQKAVFAHHINSDAMLDVVLGNIEMVRDALDKLDTNEQQ